MFIELPTGSITEWIHFTLVGIILPTIKLKVCTFWGLWTQQRRLPTGSITLLWGCVISFRASRVLRVRSFRISQAPEFHTPLFKLAVGAQLVLESWSQESRILKLFPPAPSNTSSAFCWLPNRRLVNMPGACYLHQTLFPASILATAPPSGS